MRERIAIVGGGMAGLAAGYLLHRDHDVVLYEKDDRVGGNAHTIRTREGLNFDIAAAVFGRNTYPNFIRLLRELDVPTCRLSGNGVIWRDLDTGEQSYLAMTPRGFIANGIKSLDPRFALAFAGSMWSLQKGKDLCRANKLGTMTMTQALAALPPMDERFRLMHMFLTCLVSSMLYDDVMKAPASFFFAKRIAHRDFFENPVFSLFIPRDNTLSYTSALAARLGDKVVLNARLRQVRRGDHEVVIEMEDGATERFTKVVFACNADQALALLDSPSDDERRLLGAWRYQHGPIVVHRDRSSFPAKEFYNLFTFLYSKRDGKISTSVNGHIRNLKTVPNDCPIISSQHPNFPIAPELIEFQKIFRTPIFDAASVATIPQLPSLNGKLNTYYCGSHFGYGLHEDCVNSALDVARGLGVSWG
jgi:uncharacterized protein